MKILLIDNYYYHLGGAQTVFFNTKNMLEQNGHKVIVFSQNREKNLPSKYSNFFIKPIENKSLFKATISYIYNIEAKRNLEKLIIQEKPDIAHAHLLWCGIGVSIFSVLKKHNIPLVHTVHDYRMICPAYTFKNGKGIVCEKCEGHNFYYCLLEKCSKNSLAQSLLMTIEMYFRNLFFNPSKNIQGLIFVSKFSRDKHFHYAPELKKRHNCVIYNSSSYDEMDERENNSKYFLYYGRLSHEKGIKTLIEAFSINKLQLRIVGSGPLENELKMKCSELSLNNIIFEGYKSGEKLKDIIKNAKFVIVPSEWYENNPMTIVESYSFGIPVIGADIGGIPEIIRHGETGFVFKMGNVEDLVQIIDSANTISQSQYQQMRTNSRLFADEHFNEKNSYVLLMEFYNKLLTAK